MQPSNPKRSRSKLELYLDILRILAHNGPSKQSHIEDKINCCISLKENLGFLTKRGLVEEQSKEKRAVFAVTPRGITVLKYFSEYTHGISVTKEM